MCLDDLHLCPALLHAAIVPCMRALAPCAPHTVTMTCAACASACGAWSRRWSSWRCTTRATAACCTRAARTASASSLQTRRRPPPPPRQPRRLQPRQTLKLPMSDLRIAHCPTRSARVDAVALLCVGQPVCSNGVPHRALAGECLMAHDRHALASASCEGTRMRWGWGAEHMHVCLSFKL